MMKTKKLLTTAKLLAMGVFAFTINNGNAQTTTFNYTGGMQTYTVPAFVTTITVDAYGAQGGGAGGLGGRVQATMTVVPGNVLNIYVGGQGGPVASSSAGGYNGGGTAGVCTVQYAGSGGGGASDIRSGGTALANRVLVAGGGGGTQQINGNPGAGGGLTGGNVGSTGNGCISLYATGGTQAAGGAQCTTSGGCCTFTILSTGNGALGLGGNGSQ